MNILSLAGPGSKYQVRAAAPAGFLAGLWHGLVSPFTFFASLFTPAVRIYEVHNTGRGYDCGFILGASFAFGGGARSAPSVGLSR